MALWEGKAISAIHMEAWACPAPGMTLDDLIVHMEQIGNTVLIVDRENNRLKVADYTENHQ